MLSMKAGALGMKLGVNRGEITGWQLEAPSIPLALGQPQLHEPEATIAEVNLNWKIDPPFWRKKTRNWLGGKPARNETTC